MTMAFCFPDFTALRNFCQNYFYESSLPMSRIFEKTAILYKRQRRSDFCQMFARYDYEAFSLFKLTVLWNFHQNYFLNHHFRWVTSWPKTTISHKRQRWGDSCHIFARYNYEGFPLCQFHGLRNFRQNYFLNRHPRWVASWSKRQFCTCADGGRIYVRFPPTTITRNLRFSDFTALRNFHQNYFLNRHSR